LSKLEHVLPPKLRTQLEDISEATVSTLTNSAFSADHASLAVAASAARTRQRMRFTYTDAEGRVTERHTEPLRLVHTGRRWYLVAFDLDRDDWRTFRLDRLSDPVSTGMRSARRPEPDPVEMVQRGVAIDAYALRATIRMSTSIEQAAQMIPPTMGALESLGPTTTRLVIGADDVQWLARYLLGFPWDFEVDSPTELSEELTTIGRRLLAVHAPGSASTASGSASSSPVAVPVSDTMRNDSGGKWSATLSGQSQGKVPP
jgi:predicted DNA-binding transcriptional regulator YafY